MDLMVAMGNTVRELERELRQIVPRRYAAWLCWRVKGHFSA